MTRDIEQVLLLLAGSNVKLSSIREFVRWAEDVGPKSVDMTVRELRFETRQIIMGLERSWVRDRPDDVRTGQPRGHESSAHRVKDLLLQESGLTAKVASHLLLEAVARNSKVDPDSLPKLNKENFVRWVDKLSKHCTYSEILHAATRIRNDLIHSKSRHWPLRSRE